MLSRGELDLGSSQLSLFVTVDVLGRAEDVKACPLLASHLPAPACWPTRCRQPACAARPSSRAQRSCCTMQATAAQATAPLPHHASQTASGAPSGCCVCALPAQVTALPSPARVSLLPWNSPRQLSASCSALPSATAAASSLLAGRAAAFSADTAGVDAAACCEGVICSRPAVAPKPPRCVPPKAAQPPVPCGASRVAFTPWGRVWGRRLHCRRGGAPGMCVSLQERRACVLCGA